MHNLSTSKMSVKNETEEIPTIQPTPDLDRVLAEWNANKEQIAVLKKREAELRKWLIPTLFADRSKGTRHVSYRGCKLSGSFTENVTVEKTEIEAMEAKHGKAKVSKVIRTDYKLNVSEFKKQTKDFQEDFEDRVLITTEGSASLKLALPKVETEES